MKEFQLSNEKIDKLHQLIEEVLLVNQQFNLTSVREPEAAWTKHVVDSLQGLKTNLFEGHKAVIDVGSGAGFPGLALAIARPELKLRVLDATRKKCDFMQATSDKFELNVKAMNERAEDAGQSVVWRERFDIGIARAVGGLSEVCELVLPFVKVGGHAILWRGEKGRDEARVSKGAVKILGGAFGENAFFPYYLPDHELKYHILVIEKIKRTPGPFPRRVGIPKQKPL